jgi:sensor histidine kinase YesM
MVKDDNNQSELGFHMLFWSAIWLFGCFQSMWANYTFWDVIGHASLILVPQLLAGYTLAYWQVPQLLYKRKYLLFALSLLVSVYMFSVLARIMVVYIIEELYREPPFIKESIPEILTDLVRLIKGYVFKVYSYASAFTVAVLIRERFVSERKQQSLIQEKVTSELNFLKAQVHPHFLFNTLNNLYVLTLQKSDKAPETVMKLSQMLDYMLYQCDGDRVPLSKEVALIQNYIELEKLRYGDRLSLRYDQSLDDPECPIAPLLLVPLIENAFKHGASTGVGQPWITIEITLKGGRLRVKVANGKAVTKPKDDTQYTKGIGLGNMRNQLQLIYPERHRLEIEETPMEFHVHLEIEL